MITKISTLPHAASAPRRSRPLHQTPAIPLVVLAMIVIALYMGFLIFPVIKQVINQQDCIASGRTDCIPRSE